MATATKSTKESATKDLKTQLNEAVERYSEIDAIFIYDLENNTLLDHSDNTKKPESRTLVEKLFAANTLEMADSLSEFGDIRALPDALGSLGKETSGGELKYATFQLSQNIVQAYFLSEDHIGNKVAICFIHGQPLGLGKFVLQCEKNFEPIKTALVALF